MSRSSVLGDYFSQGYQGVPHIIPGVLYPAVAGKGIDGSTTVTSFGTDFAISGYATLKYYYTDIKGSKPIKDPRIGAHFGSQRHKFTSLQLLEQETATHGSDVYSIDGRDWCRKNGLNPATDMIHNDASGVYFYLWRGTATCIEVTGYFSDINLLLHIDTSNNFYKSVDGGSQTADTGATATVNTPLGSRYVDKSSVYNLNLGQTLGIHTVKIQNNNASNDTILSGIELITQDTTSTTTKSQIQIPSQNVVSYGKKFTVADTPHYNPFAFKTDGATAWTSGNHNGTAWPVGTGSSANIDTATSLGLAAWVSTNYYYPYNGGRVVKWVASDGTIKTSVNMMPPNARNISSTASNEKGDDSAGTTSAAVVNTQYLPTFTDQAVDHSQAEVAKTFHWREFGNGAANGGTGAAWADASMLTTTADNIAYVMDDGLTSLSGDRVQYSDDGGKGLIHSNVDLLCIYITFIGTGITIEVSSNFDGNDEYDKYVDGVQVVDGGIDRDAPVVYRETLAQNLPYGTHVVKLQRGAATPNQFNETYKGFTFHQPKMPPIPEEAVVLADYMLMADFVPQTAAGLGNISKGVRYVAPSRDMFYDRTVAGSQQGNPFQSDPYIPFGGDFYAGNAVGTETRSLTVFGDSFVMYFRTNTDNNTTSVPITAGSAGTTALNNWTLTGVGSGVSSISAAGALVSVATGETANAITAKAGASVDLGVQTLKSVGTIAVSQYWYYRGYGIHTPIHTSSHYQPFETPFLYELIGGDRNVEQTNLVITPDGKTWDEVTRNTSYIGNNSLEMTTDTASSSNSTVQIFDEHRGIGETTGRNYHNKDFAIAYDRQICLRDGWYHIHAQTITIGAGVHVSILHNGTEVIYGHAQSENHDTPSTSIDIFLKRGDYIQIKGRWYGSKVWSHYFVSRLK